MFGDIRIYLFVSVLPQIVSNRCVMSIGRLLGLDAVLVSEYRKRYTIVACEYCGSCVLGDIRIYLFVSVLPQIVGNRCVMSIGCMSSLRMVLASGY